MDTKDIYISMEQIDKCQGCGRKEDLRLGYCFDCAEAETIIASGSDMYDEGNAQTAMEKVKMLIDKGWIPPKEIEGEQHEIEVKNPKELTNKS